VPDAPETVRLAEHSALRAEINQRTSFQHALVALNLTAVATTIGFVIADNASKHLLLILPLVSPALGLLWLDHNRMIRVLADYIRDELWHWTPSWETYVGRRRPSSPWWSLAFWGSVFSIFLAAPIAGLVIGFPKGSTAGSWALWLAGVGLSALYGLAYVAGVTVWTRRPADQASRGSSA
jgi:hypothetical protein